MAISQSDLTSLFSALPDSVSTLDDPKGLGCFLKFTADKPAASLLFPLGALTGVRRFTACARYEPYWMRPRAGTQAGQIPVETQWLLLDLADGRCAAVVPLIDGAFRASVQGDGEDGLAVLLESGDPAVVTADAVSLFVAFGDDPYALIPAAAESVSAWMGIGRRRVEKALPAFVDGFGWCTWDAFYQEVSQEKVRTGLESFRKGGITPKYLILDDGWQSVEEKPSGETRLTAFPANEKFPGDLKPTVEMVKSEFGVETFLVWHAVHGYWGGVDGDALPKYGVRAAARDFSPGVLASVPTFNGWWGGIVGLPSTEGIYAFYQDYHRHLREQGVDGVKVDVQANLEGVSAGQGGRVQVMRRYHEALEGSVQVHFQGNLINCMSCANEMLYGALNSTITRTSTDFWPNDPASHGLHLYVNAQVSAWFGEFVHPDWDMFQSGHPMGAYHAAGRAVSGSPVYVSDKPDAHDFDLLRKLVLPDGTVLRAQEPGRPTRDCLFFDPTKEDVLLKIFNTNIGSGVVGVFNARYAAEETLPAIAGAVRPSDVVGLAGERFAVYAHHGAELRLLSRDEAWEVALDPLTAEVFTVVPVEDGLAPLGLLDQFNSAGAVTAKGRDAAGRYALTARGGGQFGLWAERQPSRVTLDGQEQAFEYDAATGLLTFPMEAAGTHQIVIG